MADYKKMYYELLIEMNDTIDRFKKKLDKVEDIYIETETDLECTKTKIEKEYH